MYLYILPNEFIISFFYKKSSNKFNLFNFILFNRTKDSNSNLFLQKANLLDGKRQAESTYEDFYIRKFLYGTFSGLFASEIIIKRRFNTIDISFLANLPRAFYPEKVYFLVGYTEELLSNLLKCVVKVNVQTIKSKRDLVFRNW